MCLQAEAAECLPVRTGVQEHTCHLGSVTLGHEGQGLGGREAVSPPILSSVLAPHPLACLWTDAGTASRTAAVKMTKATVLFCGAFLSRFTCCHYCPLYLVWPGECPRHTVPNPCFILPLSISHWSWTLSVSLVSVLLEVCLQRHDDCCMLF